MMDEYYRQFSGHTQINATDLRNIRYPSLDQLIAIGNALGDAPPDQDALDKVVTEKLDMARQNQPMTTKKMVDEALDVLRELGVPRAQLNSRSALTLLSLLDLKPGDKWSSALGPLRGITEMMDYFRDQFGVTYAPNTRETVRCFTVHQFVQMGLLVANPDDPMRPINSPHTRYQIEPTLLKLVKAYRSKTWERNLEVYRQQASSIRVLHEADRQMHQVAVTLPDGGAVKLSAGGQNTLIKQIVEEFCSRYTPGGQVLYLGDAGKKHKVHERERLAELGVVLDEHAKMPDVIVHFSKRNWLVLIEAVTSHGPIDLKRHNELKALFATSKAPLAFVTAFENRRTLVKYMQAIAWETDVWVAESPTHLIHFNGERYLGPYEYQRNRGATTSSVLANKPARSSDARRKRRD